MYDSRSSHPRPGVHFLRSYREHGEGDRIELGTPRARVMATKRYEREVIAEGLAEHAAEREAVLLDSMTDGERQMYLYGRDRTMEALHAEALRENDQHDAYGEYDAWWDDFTTGDRPSRRTPANGRRVARFAADVDLEERALRRDGVIHFAGLASKRRAAKRTWVTKGAPFDPSKVSRSLSPAFAEQVSA